MLLCLSPAFVRPIGHTVHRAADAQRHQHPGYGAASGHDSGGKTLPQNEVMRRVCEVS